jgi:hypothetical protein
MDLPPVNIDICHNSSSTEPNSQIATDSCRPQGRDACAVEEQEEAAAEEKQPRPDSHAVLNSITAYSKLCCECV